MYDLALKKAYKTAFDFIMPTHTVTKNIPPRELTHILAAAPLANRIGTFAAKLAQLPLLQDLKSSLKLLCVPETE
jgi:hypothetical protein